MTQKLYTIKDTVTGEMLMPFTQVNDATMLRGAKIMVKVKEENFLNQNIKDKQIYRLGTFDNVTGEIKSEVKFICNAIDLLEKPERTAKK